MAQRPKKRIVTRWGYLSDALNNLGVSLWAVGGLLSQEGGIRDWWTWNIIPALALMSVLVILLGVSSFINLRNAAQLFREKARWSATNYGTDDSVVWKVFMALMASAFSVTALMAMMGLVQISSAVFFCWIAIAPLMWLSVGFGWKHRRERRAIERTMNELAQTLANIAGEKAQRGTNAPVGGVSRRASWAHWWTDAGTRDAVQEKQENRHR